MIYHPVEGGQHQKNKNWLDRQNTYRVSQKRIGPLILEISIIAQPMGLKDFSVLFFSQIWYFVSKIRKNNWNLEIYRKS